MRVQVGAAGIALILFCREETGSYAVAGAVSAGWAAGAAVGSQVWSRAIDRRGRALLPRLALLHAAIAVMLFLAVRAGGPTIALATLGLGLGFVFPPMGPVLRTMWPQALADRPDLLSSALALDSILIELSFTTGPLLVVLTGLVTTPGVALLIGAGAAVVGTFAFLARATAPPAVAGAVAVAGRRARRGALASPSIATIVLAMVPLGLCFGAIEVALPAFADEEGRAGIAGVPVALWSLGSAVGGLTYGAIAWRGELHHRYLRLMLGFPVVYALLPLAPGLVVLVVLAFVAGTTIAPALTAGYELVSHRALPGTATEAMAWPATALVVGIGTGNVLGGLVVEAADARAALTLAAAAALLSTATVLGRRRTLARV